MEAVSNPAIKVVSFNLFGTLLLRPYAKPSDIFLHLAQIHNVPDFPEMRLKVQSLLNNSLYLEEIYEQECLSSYRHVK